MRNSSINLRSLPLVTDGPRIYFTEASFSAPTTLVQVSVTGGDTVPMLSQLNFPNLGDLSGDTSQVLLVNASTGDEWPLWNLHLPGGSAQRVGDVLAHDATWFPDGRHIVYFRGSDIYFAPPNGSESRKVTTVKGIPWLPRWSPDGSVLRFTVQDFDSDSHSLWEISGDGSNLHPLLPGWNTPSAECCRKWTPDGNITFFNPHKQAGPTFGEFVNAVRLGSLKASHSA